MDDVTVPLDLDIGTAQATVVASRRSAMPRHRAPTARHGRGIGLRRGLQAALVGAVGAASLVISTLPPAAPPSPGQGNGVAAAAEPAPVPIDPRAFSESGCLALPARGGPPAATVVLDAGHGGPDPGASGTSRDGRSVSEKEMTLAVTLAAAEQLRADGTTVVLTRTTDALGSRVGNRDGALTTDESQADLEARVSCANRARADVLVAVHFNSFEDTTVGGTETLYEPDRPDADRSRALARSLQSAMLARLSELGRPPADRGIVDDSSGGEAGGRHLVLLGPRVPGYIDEPSAMPAALVEPLFITNADDLGVVATPSGTGALGAAVASGIEEYLDGVRRR